VGEITIRRFQEGDSYEQLTDLLHTAYAEWLLTHQRFTATDQPAEMTRKRCASGPTWLATVDGEWIGTIHLQRADPDRLISEYRDPAVAIFGQFGILPEWKGRGVGRLLFDVVKAEASGWGCQRLLCDTSENATRLQALYDHLGMKLIGAFDWPTTKRHQLAL
jgi:GNAT superfamily N-acetyltransferase